MKQLTLLRHAKSSWAEPEQDDHERPLNARGKTDAPDMANRLLEKGCSPDLILCSSAKRTQQTAGALMQTLGCDSKALTIQGELYLATAGTILDYIQQTDSQIEHCMVIGHNPGLEMLGRQLHPSAPMQLPTCAVLHFALHSNSFALDENTEIELLFYDFPKSRKR